MNTASNPQLELAFDYVSQTNKHIFLTGKAGTGKTTFLRRVRREVPKRMAVVAPTGVAAINAEGVTIHSLFQLPFGPLVPGQVSEQMKQRRFTRKKINLIKSLDLLIIDEISMVRADVLDAMDEVLRRYRNYAKQFGGVQLLMIGDLHQLPPVVKPHEWDMLRMHYQTPYFFGCLALQKADAVTIELKHIYRQVDNNFIDLLGKVRANQMDADVLKKLNSRYQPDFQPKDDAGYITLTSHNATAQATNAEKLTKIPGTAILFTADIEGDFPAHAYPTEVELEFKENAQVMFVKNDLSPEKLYYNGKIGRIVKIGKEQIYVLCPGEQEEIVVSRAEWHNRKYTLDEGSKEVNEELIGSFTQYPLKLAWAITIHKSQGLTFERVVIDAQAAFAHGQVYVALSRCKTFEGIVLRTQLIPESVKTDTVVQNYTEDAQQNEPGPEQLLQAKREYQQGLLRELFQFKASKRYFEQVRRLLLENENSLQGNPAAEIGSLLAKAQEKVFGVADKFLRQLEGYLAQPIMPEENEALKDRLSKAGTYFAQQIKDTLIADIEELQILTDNKAVEKKVKEKLDDLKKELAIKKACAEVCSKGFDSKIYVRSTVDAELDFQASPTAAKVSKLAPKDIKHPELYQQLAQWRADTADEQDVPRYAILPTKTILEIVEVLPTNSASLKKINGIGKSRAEKFGEALLQMVTEYCQKHQLTTDLLNLTTGKPPKTPKPPKPDSKLVSLELFRSGKTIEEIAVERGFVPTTIQGHLAHFIGLGELAISQLLDQQKVDQIIKYFETADTDALTDAKNHFGDQYSYGELRMVLKYWRSIV
ncbi:MAG: helicase [Saprospiraceae bacterium]|nr:MAG: helicase [Saprospiraceae bacterium]